jgi:hypothetical protein
MNRETLMTSSGKHVDGKNLWRKFNETKGYIMRYCNPIWTLQQGIAMNNNLSQKEALQNILSDLWVLKEKEKVLKMPDLTPLPYDPEWVPKEWLAFMYCGIPAGSGCLPVFQPDKVSLTSVNSMEGK